MNWDAIGAIAELLGAVGVIASLIYLAKQIRHSGEQMQENTRAARSAAYQQFENSIHDRAMSQVTVPGLARIVMLGMSDLEQLDEEEGQQFALWKYGNMRGFDDAYYQYQLGMFDEGRWQMSIAELKWNLQHPGVITLWEQMRLSLSPAFVAVVEEILAEEPEGSGIKSPRPA
jgi:hypothetical protein